MGLLYFVCFVGKFRINEICLLEKSRLVFFLIPTLAVVTGAGRSAEAVLAVRCLSVKIFTSFYFPLYTFEVICPFLSVGIEKGTS